MLIIDTELSVQEIFVLLIINNMVIALLFNSFLVNVNLPYQKNYWELYVYYGHLHI